MDKIALTRFFPEAQEFLRRQVEVNSFTGNPFGIRRNAEIVGEQFRGLGFQTVSYPAVNSRFGDHLFLSRAGAEDTPGLLLVTHLDTVYPAEEERCNSFRWEIEGDRVYGPGVNDNKGGTAMIWLVLSALRASEPELFESTNWVVAANAAEEELVPDFPELCQAHQPRNCRAALVFEACGGMGHGLTLVQCRKGSANFRVVVEGRGAHAGSRHHEGANAILEMAGLVQQIEALTDSSRQLTANVGAISGGGPSNRVPHAAECLVNIRAFAEPVLQEAVDAMLELEHQPATVRAASDGFPCRIKVELLSRNPAWGPNAGTDELIAIWLDAAKELGTSLLVEPRGGLSDGNYLSRFLPVLDGLGPFGLHGHASERSADGAKVPEFASLSSFVEMGAINATAIVGLLRR